MALLFYFSELVENLFAVRTAFKWRNVDAPFSLMFSQGITYVLNERWNVTGRKLFTN